MSKNTVFSFVFIFTLFIGFHRSALAIPLTSSQLLLKPVTQQPFEANINMTCVTEFPSTSFIVRQNDSKVSVRVIHHNGTQYAPIWSGLVTPHDLIAVQEAAHSVAKLGQDFEITWNRKGCNADSEMFFQCVGEAEDFLTSTGELVHPWALSIYDIVENSIYGEFRKKTVSLRFNINQKAHQITMDYMPSDCFIDPLQFKKTKVK